MRKLVMAAAVAGVGVVALAPVLFQQGREVVEGGRSDEVLVVVTPHNEQIRQEMARGFNRWRQQSGRKAVVFDWRSWGGTSELVRGVVAAYEAEGRRAAAAGEAPGGVGYDVLFGGGVFEHSRLAKGLSVAGAQGPVAVAVLEPIRLPEGMLQEVFPQPKIGGEPLYDGELRWVGVALSSFGIVYNRDVLAMLGLAEPRTWTDLIDEKEGRYRGWVILADPAQSGSVATTYETILRRLGWEEGWGVLRRMGANTRNFVQYASGVPVSVSAGEAAAGTCIDFYGRYQAGAVGEGRVGYVDPKGMTSVSADPVAVFHGAPHRELAEEFVRWLLSRDGQRLWQRKRGTAGGPVEFELRRLPVRRDLYVAEEMGQWTDATNAFEIAEPLPEGMPSFFALVAPVMHAMVIDVLPELQAAWGAILEEPEGPRRQRMLAAFDVLPEDLRVPWTDAELAKIWPKAMKDPTHARHGECVAALRGLVERVTGGWREDPDRRYEDQQRWTRFFKRQYEKAALGGEPSAK